MKKLLTLSIAIGCSLASFAQKADSTKTPVITLRGTSTTGVEPLIVIDGNKQYTRGTMSLGSIDPNNIEAINVLKDSSAVNKYGTDGFAGVIEIKTKNSPFKPNDIPRLKIDSVVRLRGSVSGFNVTPGSKRPLNVDPAVKSFLLYKDTDSKAKPIYVLDGKQVPDVKGLDPNTILSITVLKDASDKANEYGGKGKDGVIMITTKKDKGSSKKKN